MLMFQMIREVSISLCVCVCVCVCVCDEYVVMTFQFRICSNERIDEK
jgi:hypothetical protein